MLGFVSPTQGMGTVLGQDIASQDKLIRQRVGFMPEQECYIPGLSAVSLVAFAGMLSGMPEAEANRRSHEVLEYSGLGEARYRAVETYSTGMKQRLKFAQAMVHGPQLMLLDEPTNGLDPRGRDEMLDLIIDISRNKGVHVLISSHLLPDIERVCENVIVMMRGRVVASGLLSDLKAIEGEPLDVELAEHSVHFVNEISATGLGIMPLERNTYRVMGKGTQEETVRQIFAFAQKTQVKVRKIKKSERSLEEAFLKAVSI
jgi:ABC-2 type transport system ATP-binding protein